MGSSRSARRLIEPPLVSDGILFRILQDLLYLDGERISYRALDVEQIGSVYEAMMGFTVETAHGISIGLGSDHLVIDLEDLLTKKPADRAKWLKENADCEVTGKAIEQLKSAASVDELLAALRRRISKLYLDQNSNPVTVPADGIYLQPTRSAAVPARTTRRVRSLSRSSRQRSTLFWPNWEITPRRNRSSD